MRLLSPNPQEALYPLEEVADELRRELARAEGFPLRQGLAR